MNTKSPHAQGSSTVALCEAIPTAQEGMPLGLLECPESLFCGAAAERFARFATTVCQRAPHMILDLSRVARIDGAGLRAVARLARICRSAGGEMRVCSPTSAVRLLLVASGLHEIAAVFPSRRQAEYDLVAA